MGSKKALMAAAMYGALALSASESPKYERTPSKSKKQASQKDAKTKKRRAKNKAARKSRKQNRK